MTQINFLKNLIGSLSINLEIVETFSAIEGIEPEDI